VSEKTFMTPEGKKTLENELKKLLKIDRPAGIKAIEEARAHGDLSENAEYHAARERQAFMAGRISEIKNQLATAQVIDPSKMTFSKRITFGSTVTLVDEDSGKKTTYKIVGIDEADIKAGMISYKSPLARTLVNKEEGDVVEHRIKDHIKVYKITSVIYK